MYFLFAQQQGSKKKAYPKACAFCQRQRCQDPRLRKMSRILGLPGPPWRHSSKKKKRCKICSEKLSKSNDFVEVKNSFRHKFFLKLLFSCSFSFHFFFLLLFFFFFFFFPFPISYFLFPFFLFPLFLFPFFLFSFLLFPFFLFCFCSFSCFFFSFFLFFVFWFFLFS